MNIVRSSRENRFAVYLITAMLFGAGDLTDISTSRKQYYPEVNFPRIMILVHSGDLPPDTMLLSVTRPLEEAAMTVQGVYRVRSKTSRGASEISVLFNSDADMQYSLQLLQGSVNEARTELPATTQLCRIERRIPDVSCSKFNSKWRRARSGFTRRSFLRTEAAY